MFGEKNRFELFSPRDSVFCATLAETEADFNVLYNSPLHHVAAAENTLDNDVEEKKQKKHQ